VEYSAGEDISNVEDFTDMFKNCASNGTFYYNPEYDVFSDAGKNNLTAITNNGGGDVITGDDTDTLFEELEGQIRVLEYDVSTPVAILILILFICDILFRTIVLKKPKKDKAEMTDEEQAASMKGR
jgi:hypothetical protein